MERRGFIKGLLTAVAGTVATVQLAKPGEAEALIAQRDLLLSQPEPTNLNAAMDAIQSAPEVYARVHGRFVAIGYLRASRLHRTVTTSPAPTVGVVRLPATAPSDSRNLFTDSRVSPCASRDQYDDRGAPESAQRCP